MFEKQIDRALAQLRKELLHSAKTLQNKAKKDSKYSNATWMRAASFDISTKNGKVSVRRNVCS